MTERNKYLELIHDFLCIGCKDSEILKLVIKHYAEIYFDEEGHSYKTWPSDLNANRINFIKKYVLVSSGALEIINSMNAGNYNTFRKKIHHEHITPVSYVYEKIINLDDISVESIKNCLIGSKVVYITRDEKNILDGVGSLISHEDVVAARERYANSCFVNEINDELIGRRYKDTGCGLIRIHKLITMMGEGNFLLYSDGDFIEADDETIERYLLSDNLINIQE